MMRDGLLQVVVLRISKVTTRLAVVKNPIRPFIALITPFIGVIRRVYRVIHRVMGPL